LAGRSGDAILVVGNTQALQYYYEGNLPIQKGRPGAESLRMLAKDHRRLWLIEIRPWESDPHGQIRAVFDKLGRRSGYKKFSGVEIYIYDFSD
jgi:hypothetical protein